MTGDGRSDGGRSDQARADRRGRRGRQWLVLLAGPTLWALHLVLGYVFLSNLCVDGLRFGGPGIARWLPVLSAAVMAGLMAWAGRRAYRSWREAGGGFDPPPSDAGPEEARRWWVGVTALLLNGVFLVGVAMNVLAFFWLRPCL